MTRRLKWTVGISTLLLLLFVSIGLAMSIGEVNFTIDEILDIYRHREGIQYTIIQKVRFPRVFLGFAVGGALSLSGVILQGIYRNPLVEPYTLGISGGGALGVAIAIVFSLNVVMGSYMLPFAGFVGSLIAIFMVYFLAMGGGRFNIHKMLLIGVMISFISSSAMMFLMSTTTAENLNSIVFWVMGSLDELDMFLIKVVFYMSVLGLVVGYLFANPLNALRLGESKAQHLGINTKLSIRVLFVTASLLTGVSVSVTGVIGFVGLVIPHFMRVLFGSDYRILLITSFLGGGIFIILCDIIARTIIAPNELPIGVITGIIGGLAFIVVLSKTKFNIS